jgi:hypothetical protein
MTDVTPREWGELHLKLNRQAKQLALCVEALTEGSQIWSDDWDCSRVPGHAATRNFWIGARALLRDVRGEGEAT